MSDLTVIDKIIRAAKVARDAAKQRAQQCAGPVETATYNDAWLFDDFIAALEEMRKNPRD